MGQPHNLLEISSRAIFQEFHLLNFSVLTAQEI